MSISLSQKEKMVDNNEPVKVEGILTRMYHFAKTSPDHRAFVWLNGKGEEEEIVTNAEMYRDVKALAHKMRADYKVKPKERVLLIFAPGLDFCRAFLACMYADVTAVPVYPPDPRNPTKGMSKLLSAYNKAKPRLALIDLQFKKAKRLQGVLKKGPPYPKDLRFEAISSKMLASVSNPPETPQEKLRQMDASTDLAFVQFTSGSTGDPKGVMISMSALSSNLHAIQNTLLTSEKSVVCAWLPFYHDLGLVVSRVGKGSVR